MKATYLGLMGMLLATMSAKAQINASAKTAYNDESHNSYDHVNYENGKRIERMKMEWNDKTYKAEFANNKLTSLYVGGEKIAEADWIKYSDAIATIREQIKRNQEQAKRNEMQAKKNQEQAARNEQQNKRNAEQAVRNEQQAKRNDEQAQLNQLQEKKNAEQATRNEMQNQKNDEQAVRNEAQAKLNQEQAARNEVQAKRNAEQAAENERFMKQITEDLVNDKIIPDASSLRELIYNEDGMTVNGVKQPEAIFKKYKAKYPRFSNNQFSYSRDGIIEGK